MCSADRSATAAIGEHACQSIDIVADVSFQEGVHSSFHASAPTKGKGHDVILVEALDRLSRDQEDLAGIWKRLNFLGVSCTPSMRERRTRSRSVSVVSWARCI